MSGTDLEEDEFEEIEELIHEKAVHPDDMVCVVHVCLMMCSILIDGIFN